MSMGRVDLEGLVFLVSSICSGLHPFSASSSYVSLSSKGRDLMVTSHVGLSIPMSLDLSIMSSCGSPYLFLSVAGGSLSEDGLSIF